MTTKEFDIKYNIRSVGKKHYGTRRCSSSLCGREIQYVSKRLKTLRRIIRVAENKKTECHKRNPCLHKRLSVTHPVLANFIIPNKQFPLTASDITFFAVNKIIRSVLPCGHENICWPRFIGRCKSCSFHGTSLLQEKLFHHLEYVIRGAKSRQKPYGKEVDIFWLKYKLGIEVNAGYYHKDEEKVKKDIEKYNTLSKNGVILIIINELGYEKIADVEFQYDYKKQYKGELKRLLIQILDYIKSKIIIPKAAIDRIKKFTNEFDENQYKYPQYFYDRLNETRKYSDEAIEKSYMGIQSLNKKPFKIRRHYDSIRMWKNADKRAYQIASERGMLPEICKKMSWAPPRESRPSFHWSSDNGKFINEDRILQYIIEYKLKNPKAQLSRLGAVYEILKTNKSLMEKARIIIPATKRPKGYWRKRENCFNEMKQHLNAEDFKNNSNSAFHCIHTYNRQWLDEYFPDRKRRN